jgi:SET domain-containing protein
MLIKNGWLYPPTKIYIAKSPIHGLGVFANKDIPKDEIIEITPLIDIEVTPDNDSKILYHYRFSYVVNGKITKLVIPLGYGGVYNHSNIPNASWRLNENLDMFEFYSIKDIKEHEEICTSYGNEEYWNSRPYIKIK